MRFQNQTNYSDPPPSFPVTLTSPLVFSTVRSGALLCVSGRSLSRDLELYFFVCAFLEFLGLLGLWARPFFRAPASLFLVSFWAFA